MQKVDQGGLEYASEDGHCGQHKDMHICTKTANLKSSTGMTTEL